VTVGFSFADEPAVNSQANSPWPPPGHTTAGAVRTRECNHEMSGLPYPAFRRVNAERGGGKPSPYALRNSMTTQGQASCLPSLSAGPTLGCPRGAPLRFLGAAIYAGTSTYVEYEWG
jgi:hypothetical protein